MHSAEDTGDSGDLSFICYLRGDGRKSRGRRDFTYPLQGPKQTGIWPGRRSGVLPPVFLAAGAAELAGAGLHSQRGAGAAPAGPPVRPPLRHLQVTRATGAAGEDAGVALPCYRLARHRPAPPACELCNPLPPVPPGPGAPGAGSRRPGPPALLSLPPHRRSARGRRLHERRPATPRGEAAQRPAASAAPPPPAQRSAALPAVSGAAAAGTCGAKARPAHRGAPAAAPPAGAAALSRPPGDPAHCAAGVTDGSAAPHRRQPRTAPPRVRTTPGPPPAPPRSPPIGWGGAAEPALLAIGPSRLSLRPGTSLPAEGS